MLSSTKIGLERRSAEITEENHPDGVQAYRDAGLTAKTKKQVMRYTTEL